MWNEKEDILQLAEEFESCRSILLALGDENRQHLILTMMQMEGCGGVRVSEIKERSHLSRPAVSHHIQILKNAGIVKMRRENPSPRVPGCCTFLADCAKIRQRPGFIHSIFPPDFLYFP